MPPAPTPRAVCALASLALTLASSPAFAGVSAVPSFVAQSGAPGPFTVSTAGDVNGDGFSDLIVGAPAWSDDPGAAPGKGRVFVYLGSASGLSPVADWVASGTASGMELGSAVSTAGDLDDDGFDDIVVAARGYSNGESAEGGVFVWLGRADFASLPDASEANADWRAESDQAGSDFGCSVANAGDLNGDGFADLVVGARGFDAPGPGTHEGAVFVWLGAIGLAGLPDGTPLNADWLAYGAPNASPSAPDEGSQLGFAVSGAGDVNGDGYDDLVSSAPYFTEAIEGHVGRVLLWRGEPAFSDPANDGTIGNADWSIGSFDLGFTTIIGFDVRRAGDLDGDGLADVVAGGPDAPGWFGFSQTWVFRGNATDYLELLPSAVLIDDGYIHMGTSASTAGDVNGDGRADLIVGLPRWPKTSPPTEPGSQGGARVYLGNAASVIDAAPYAALVGFSDGALMGSSVGSAGDVNGDGFGDVAIAGSGANGEGEPRVYLGGGDSLAVAPAWSTLDLPASSGAGHSVSATGDLNGDGFGDYLIGAPFSDGVNADEGSFRPVYGGSCGPACGPSLPAPGDWSGAQADERLGTSVAGAGDVNGDGFADAIVGAPLYDASHPPQATLVDAGRVRLYLGSAGGLGLAHALEIEGTEDGGQLGAAVAGAGDVNGDGYGDVVVGEPFADAPLLPDAGRVSLFLGKPAPQLLSATPAWVAHGTRAGGHFGADVASAGDVDRDGRSDVLVGEELGGSLGLGAAHLYLGTPSGLGATPAQVFDNDASLGVPVSASGISVSAAGDVNGDGFADVVVGFPSTVTSIGGSSADGVVRVFLGGAPAPDAIPDTQISGEDGMRLGSGVGGGGDFDGDGYGDVAVGASARTGTAPGDGFVLVFHGGPSGVAGPARAAFSDTPGDASGFGIDVAANLDANGDGFADLVVGAPAANAPLEDAGTAFLHLGNGRAGVPRIFRQASSVDSPVALLGTTGEPASVEFQLYTVSPPSPAGRVRRGIATQAAALGVPFASGEERTTGALDPGSTPTVFGVLHHCDGALPCRWRARVISKSPFFPRSPWISPPGNAPLEADLRAFVDGDGDAVSEQADNCPYEPNADQSDVGGVAAGISDGIGDACQCGDPASNGIVESPDVAAIRAALAGLGAPAVTDARKCNVIGPVVATDGADFDTLRDDCGLVDVVVTRRRIAALSPNAIQVCEPALP